MGSIIVRIVSSFRDNVIAVVQAIPEGRVATYGQVAALAGSPRAARIVGGILRHAADEIPWHRVVNAQGGISTYRIGAGDLQVALLASEGVEVDEAFLDLEAYRWRPEMPGAWTELGSDDPLR
jgi:methylated-DNA-protein-cysteine methyltransferase-like protein